MKRKHTLSTFLIVLIVLVAFLNILIYPEIEVGHIGAMDAALVMTIVNLFTFIGTGIGWFILGQEFNESQNYHEQNTQPN